MNYLDLIIIIFIFLFAFQGFKKGLVYEVASLAGLILGIYASFHFSCYLDNYLIEYFDMTEKYSGITAFILIFILVVILVHFIGKIIEHIVDMVALGLLNKISGSVFGFLKALVLLSLAMLIFRHFDFGLIPEDTKEESYLYRPVERIAPMLWEDFEQYGKEKLKETAQ